MSFYEASIIMYAQALTFILVILFIVSYFFMHRSSKEVKVEVTSLEEYEKNREKNYIEVIYEESHTDDSKINNVRLHKKHHDI